jgi:predicted HTH domain antitoxin
MNTIDSIDWEINQLVKTQLFTDKQAVLRSALRALFQAQPTLRLHMVIRAYTAGDISLGKAAMLMGVSHAEMQDIVVEQGSQIHLGPLTAHELRKDAEHA